MSAICENESPALVSVIIPTFNHGRFVSEAVSSALAQTYSSLEVVVVDDGSEDDTAERLQAFGDRIRYVFKQNAGLSSARNTGLATAQGDFIAILDADDIWMPEKIAAQMKVMHSAPDIGVVGCSGYHINESGDRLDEFFKPDVTDQVKFLEQLYLKNAVGGGGSSALVRRECFDVVGGFDENLQSAEDWDMWLRISEHYRFGFVDKPLLSVRVSGGSMSAPANAERMLTNELTVIEKFFSASTERSHLLAARRSRSYRYYIAAQAFRTLRQRRKSGYYIARSIGSYPVFVFRKRWLAILLYVLCGFKGSGAGET